MFRPFKTGLYQRLGDLIGIQRIPSGGQGTDTNSKEENPGRSLK